MQKSAFFTRSDNIFLGLPFCTLNRNRTCRATPQDEGARLRMWRLYIITLHLFSRFQPTEPQAIPVSAHVSDVQTYRLPSLWHQES
jgi:hypothetical protein